MANLRTCRNSAPVGKNKLAGSVSTEGSNTSTPSPAISRAQIPTPAQARASTHGLPGMYTDVDLQKTTSFALELFIKSQEWDKALKTRNPYLYYGSFHMKCHYFCQ